MKKISFLLLNAVIAASVLLTSCGSDDTDDPAPSSPNVAVLAASTGTIDGDAEVLPGGTFTIGITVTKGDANLDEVSVNIGSNPLAASKIQTGATAAASVSAEAWTNLTQELSGDDKDGFTWYFTITTEATATDGSTQAYSIVVTDKDGVSSTTTVTITAKAATTALVEQSGDFKLFSKLGPTGYGGLDLSDGSSTGSAAGDLADITASTWDGSFTGANGTTVKSVASSYYAVAVEEDVASTYSAGTEYTGAAAPSVDDVFIAYNGTTYWVLKVTVADGNDTNVSATNGQFIQFAVKK